MVLNTNQIENLYTSAEQLAESGRVEASELIFKMLEKVYRTSMTANNLAAFYETYSTIGNANTINIGKKSIARDTIRYYYQLSFDRTPNMRAACSLGYLFFEEGKYKKALFFYKKALDIKAKAELYYNVAIQYFQLQQYKKAIMYISKAMPNLKSKYQREACLLLIYIYGLSGYGTLAREHFRRYVRTNPEVDMDLLHVAYVCQEYDYIDRNCLSFSQEEQFSLDDAEVVIRVLLMLGKDKLAGYFLVKLMNNPFHIHDELWEADCETMFEQIKENMDNEFIPKIHIRPIEGLKFYWPKA